MIRGGISATTAAFEKAAREASIHFADDSGQEVWMAQREVQKCLVIYDENPVLRRVFLALAEKELWSLPRELAYREQANCGHAWYDALSHNPKRRPLRICHDCGRSEALR